MLEKIKEIIKPVILAGLLVNFASASTAETKQELVVKLMKDSGTYDLMLKQKEMGRKQLEIQVEQMLEPVKPEFENYPDSYFDAVKESIHYLVEAVEESWTVQEAIDVYAEVWSKNYTLEELQTVCDDFSSPEYKKSMQVTTESMLRLQQYLSVKTQQAYSQGIDELMSSIKEAGKKARAEKKQNAKHSTEAE